jgi:hypothetical protein
MSHVTIVPPEPHESGVTKTMGTKVLLEDGSELQGVFRIILRAEVDSIWTAEIHCHPKMVSMTATPNVRMSKVGWWERLRSRLSKTPMDTTAMDSTSRTYVKA